MKAFSILLRVIALCVLMINSSVVAATAEVVTVTVRAAIVDSDLSVRPVPKQRFEIVPESPGEVIVTVTTSFAGECQTLLSPGKYHIRSVSPVEFGQRRFEWDVRFEVTGGGPATIELSNDNATPGTDSATDSGRPAAVATSIAGTASSAKQIFQALRDGVVTLESEGGHGSGFVVDGRGLIMTNEHVVSGSRHFTASFDDEHRLPASVVVADANEDIAILVINPNQLSHLPVVKLALDAPERPAVQEGEPVFAIGSPLHQEKIITAGIVSKVETGAIISDVMIDHGNSGGPLLNAAQEAVGINTFGEGRGVSGTVRIWKAMPLFEDAKRKMATIPIPSGEFLPSIPKTKYPVDAMKRIVMTEDFDLEQYHIVARQFDVFILTPPALCYFEHQDDIKAAKGRHQRRKNTTSADTYDPISDVKGWAQYVGEYLPIVRVEIIPRVKVTAGSAFGAALLGSNAVIHYRYQGDVDTVRLIRNGKEIQPLRLGRAPVEQRFAGAAGHMEDVAYRGYAEFLPETFAPFTGENDRMVLEIVNEAKDGATIKADIDAELLNKIWQDLAPLRTQVP